MPAYVATIPRPPRTLTEVEQAALLGCAALGQADTLLGEKALGFEFVETHQALTALGPRVNITKSASPAQRRSRDGLSGAPLDIFLWKEDGVGEQRDRE